MPSGDFPGAPARPARTVARTPRTARSDAAGPPGRSEPRWAVLWRELARARARLAEHERRAGSLETLFRTSIEPRERLLTLGAARVTSALVDHYETTSLGRAERSVLGLWVNENLESLVGHPYAPGEPVAALVERWRTLLEGAGNAPPDPADPASATYRTMPVRLDPAARERGERDAISRYLAALFGSGSNVRAATARDADERGRGPASGPGSGRASGVADEACRRAAAGSGADGSSRADDDPGSGAPGGRARRLDGLDVAAPDGARELLERLFRRLARALHPDREPDPGRRELKHVLMSTALAARRAKDLDTLLSLHAEHVGDLPDALDGADAETLVRALERQLAGMRRALERARGGDPRSDLLARYDGADDAARARRVALHAERLDAETVRLERLAEALADADGLADALDDRREIERDRLSVDELTGC